MTTRKDPYRFFRIEAQELTEGLQQGILKLETSADEALLKLLLRHAHTLKGAARVVRRPDIGDLAHRLEDILSGVRDKGSPMQATEVDAALSRIDEIRRHVASLDSKTVPSEALEARNPSHSPPVAKTDITHSLEGDVPAIRVTVEDMDRVIESVAEAHGAARALSAESTRLATLRGTVRELSNRVEAERAGKGTPRQGELESLVEDFEGTYQALRDGIERLEAELGELRRRAANLRLVPAQTLVDELQRVVRDAGRTLEKDVELVATGGETQVDAHVLAGLRAALGHVVRNSVAHGIEKRSEREQLGKPPSGTIEVSMQRMGHRVLIRCRDDGRGIDFAAVRRAAIKAGIAPEQGATALDEQDLSQVLLRGGVSTSPIVTSVSGRGVGLDAVRHQVESLRGEVEVSSVWGRGTTVEIHVPVSLSTLPTLSVYVNDTPVLVPLDSVRQALRVPQKEIERDESGERVVVGGEVIPFVPLRRVLDARSSEPPEWQSAILVEAAGRRAVIGADRLGTASDVVVRSIPEHARPLDVVSGAVLDEENLVRLLLSPQELVLAASRPSPKHYRQAIQEKSSVLVIDDSLTSRMLEQSILEAAGYDVGLAVSAEDGLEQAKTKRYDLFIVDVEMPGMNGFEFVSTVRADPNLRDTPAILVTSRADPDDKRRGRDAGARAYIVKSEFDQTVLLETIRRLIG